MTENDIKMILKFLQHIHTLAFVWCVCKTEKLLKALDEIIEHCRQLKVRKIMIRGNFELQGSPRTCQRKKLYADGINWKIELFSSLLERSTLLEVLDFGFEPDLSRNVDLLTDVISKIGTSSGKLQTLNIAAFHKESFDCAAKVDQLCKLSSLCMTWDKHFNDLIFALSSKSEAESTLKELIVTVTEVEDGVPSVSEDQWASLSKSHPGLKLKLVIADYFFKPNQPAYVEALYKHLANGKIPVLQKLVVISDGPYDINFKNWSCSVDQLEELSWICLTRDHPYYSFDFFYCGYFCKFTHLEKLAFFGIEISPEAVIEIATLFGRKLKEFIVINVDVAASYITKNIPRWEFPSIQRQIEGRVTEALGRKWQFGRYTDMESLYHNRHLWTDAKIERVLERVCL